MFSDLLFRGKGGFFMAKVAVISAILEEPDRCQQRFNEVVTGFKGIVKGRMGIPMEEYGISVISITVVGELDDINSLTGKLGNMEHVYVKTSISKKEV
jgi:putative iron-only hydrogenase system regulator